jgi:hypothetical protein
VSTELSKAELAVVERMRATAAKKAVAAAARKAEIAAMTPEQRNELLSRLMSHVLVSFRRPDGSVMVEDEVVGRHKFESGGIGWHKNGKLDTPWGSVGWNLIISVPNVKDGGYNSYLVEDWLNPVLPDAPQPLFKS